MNLDTSNDETGRRLRPEVAAALRDAPRFAFTSRYNAKASRDLVVFAEVQMDLGLTGDARETWRTLLRQFHQLHREHHGTRGILLDVAPHLAGKMMRAGLSELVEGYIRNLPNRLEDHPYYSAWDVRAQVLSVLRACDRTDEALAVLENYYSKEDVLVPVSDGSMYAIPSEYYGELFLLMVHTHNKEQKAKISNYLVDPEVIEQCHASVRYDEAEQAAQTGNDEPARALIETARNAGKHNELLFLAALIGDTDLFHSEEAHPDYVYSDTVYKTLIAALVRRSREQEVLRFIEKIKQNDLPYWNPFPAEPLPLYRFASSLYPSTVAFAGAELVRGGYKRIGEPVLDEVYQMVREQSLPDEYQFPNLVAVAEQYARAGLSEKAVAAFGDCYALLQSVKDVAKLQREDAGEDTESRCQMLCTIIAAQAKAGLAYEEVLATNAVE